MVVMTTREKIKEVENQLKRTTSPYRKIDLEKYMKRLQKELKKEKKNGRN